MKNCSNILTLILQIFIINCLFSQSGEGIETLSLDGDWEVIFDDNDQGILNKWYTNDNFNIHPSKQTVEVPSALESLIQNYEGVAFYRKQFKVPINWKNQVVEVHFEAANYKTEVWLNDEVVGFHEGGYTPFRFRVDKLLKVGENNSLVVRIVTPIILTDKNVDGLGRQEVPMWRGAINGGLWQSVSLIKKNWAQLNDVFLETDLLKKAVDFSFEIFNSKIINADASLEIEVFNKDNTKVVSQRHTLSLDPGNTNFITALKIPNMQTWDTENPYLYKAKVRLISQEGVSDQWVHKFGFREFTVQNDEFYLNGKPLYLKAAFFEGLYPVGLGYPDSKEMAIKEIKLAKEAGFNMIRPWRKPPPKMWLELCDELGILVVGSLVVECMYRPISTPRLPFVVENELRKTILSNRNRTSIVQWELFNEINRPILAQMLQEMSVLARELDPSRMILDESGGWGEGANIYLPYDKLPTKFNDIHHYSGSQVDQEEFDGYLATAKTKAEIKALDLLKNKGYGKNVVPGIMSYISELGYGSTPNLVQNNITFSAKGNPIVAPTIYHKSLDEGYRNALKKVGFDNIYPSTETFYLEQQKMHGIANKRMIEASRLNNTIKGYCVHALVGGDWVIGAGLLDLWRNPKTLTYKLTKAANQPLTTPVRILPRNVYSDQGFDLKVYAVNEMRLDDINILIEIKDSSQNTILSETLYRNFKRGISTILDKKISSSNMLGSYSVQVTLFDNNQKQLSSNVENFDIFKSEDFTPPTKPFALHDPEGSLSEFLESKNIDFMPFDSTLDSKTPLLVGLSKNKKQYDKDANLIRDYVKNGGYAVFFEVKGKTAKNTDRVLKEISKNGLPSDAHMLSKWPTLGGWAAKSHVVTDHPIFNGLPTNQIMHGVYENIHPISSMAKQEGDYIAGLIGYDHFPNNDIMVRHYNGPGEVWWAADVLEAELGKGKMLLSTLQIINYLGRDPVADKLLFNIINYLTNNP
jgi:hypothetical protein